MVISIVVAVIAISVIILVISMILCNQRNKARKSAQKLTDRMQRPYEAEVCFLKRFSFLCQCFATLDSD